MSAKQPTTHPHSDREALDRAALAALPTVTLGVSAYYLLLALAHLLIVPPPARDVLVPAAAGSAALLLGMHRMLRAGRLPAAWAHGAAGVVGLVALSNSLLHLVEVPDPKHTVNLCLVVAAAGALVFSRRWYALLVATAIAGLTAVDVFVPALASDWLHYALALGAAAVVGLLVLLVRTNGVLRNAAMERELHQRSAELERALGDAERELLNRSQAEAELRRSQSALSESEERHRAVVENALDAIVAIDDSGRVTEFNPSAERVFGHTRAEALGMPLDALLVPPELRARHRAGFERFLETRISHILDQRLELPALRADGSTFPAELAVTAVDLAGGLRFVGFLRDITEATQTRAALARERGVLQAMTAAQTTFISGSDSRAAFESLLLQCLAVAGCESGWLVEVKAQGGSGFRLDARAALWAGGPGGATDSSPEEELEKLRPHLLPALTRTEPMRIRIESGDGLLVVPVRSGAEPIGLLVLRGRDAGAGGAPDPLLGAIAQSFAALLEATRNERRRQRAEAALRESEERYRALSDHTLDVILELDRAGLVLFASPSAREVLGLPPARLFGHGFRELVHPDDRGAAGAVLEEAFRSPGGCLEITLRIVHATGSLRWLEAAGRTYRAAGGQPRLVLTARDVTARKEIERRLAEARRDEATIGARIQEALLLGKPPRNAPGLAIATLGLASDSVAGDFFDFLRPSERCLDVVVGDVMGKGIPAALIGAATKSQFLRAFAEAATTSGGALPGPAALVAAVHRELTPRLMDLECFVTLAYARFDLETQELTIVDCGHAKPLHHSVRTGACTVVEGSNLPIGVLEVERHEEIRIPFEPGDTFVFYSDGVTEAPGLDGVLFGAERLASLIEAHGGEDADALLEEIRHDVLEFTGPRELADDLTCVIVRIAEPSTLRLDGPRHLRVASDLEELETLRAFVEEAARRGCGGRLSEDRLSRLVIAVNEAASNVMRHAYAGHEDRFLDLEVEADAKRVRVRIYDDGPAFSPCAPELPLADHLAEGGYGLFLIHEAVDEVRYRRTEDGRNCVTLVQLAEEPSSAREPRSETAS